MKELNISKRIGILTLPFDNNYGWILQLWALYNVLKQHGFEPVVIDRRWNDTNSSILKKVVRWGYDHTVRRKFLRFYNSQFQHTPTVRSSKDIKRQTADLDAFVVGSDQVWRIEHTRGANLNFFFDFLADRPNARRIAYAASFGKDTWAGSETETAKVAKLLKQFNLVTVRENSGVDVCRQFFGAEAIQVLDPTCLLQAADYIKGFGLQRSDDKTLATYILNANAWNARLIDEVAMENGLRIVSLYPKSERRLSHFCSVEHWLSSIMNARYVVIDSFHGMVFAILLGKQFVVVGNVRRGLTRFTSLLGDLDLTLRLVENEGDIDAIKRTLYTPIDYTDVYAKLADRREASMQLLLGAME